MNIAPRNPPGSSNNKSVSSLSSSKLQTAVVGQRMIISLPKLSTTAGMPRAGGGGGSGIKLDGSGIFWQSASFSPWSLLYPVRIKGQADYHKRGRLFLKPFRAPSPAPGRAEGFTASPTVDDTPSPLRVHCMMSVPCCFVLIRHFVKPTTESPLVLVRVPVQSKMHSRLRLVWFPSSPGGQAKMPFRHRPVPPSLPPSFPKHTAVIGHVSVGTCVAACSVTGCTSVTRACRLFDWR